MMKKTVVGYLTYITVKNSNNRLLDFRDSIESLNLLRSNNIEIVSIDNSSIDEVRKNIKSSGLFSKHFHYQKNYFDVALFYTTLWYAKDIDADYVCFLYDDFIMYDNAINDVIEFLEQHQDVSCVRLPSYDFKNKSKYDSDITPKSINPDSIRHYNSITGKSLIWEGPFQFGEHSFYKNNWHYTSRPCVWRRSFFEKVIETQGQTSNVLQGFEAWATNEFEKFSVKTGVLDGGMLKTTPVIRSARGLEICAEKENSIKISVDEMFEEYKKMKVN